MRSAKRAHPRGSPHGRADVSVKSCGECTARCRGGCSGIDILSFELDGSDRLVEVKTTRYGKYTPFFLSRPKDTWTSLRVIAPDPDLLENTYEEWLEMWEVAFARVSAAGAHPERVEVNFDAFAARCAQHGARYRDGGWHGAALP